MQLKERTFEPLVEDGEDTWLVQFYLSPHHSNTNTNTNNPPTPTADTTTATATTASSGGKGTGGSKNLKAFASMWNEVSDVMVMVTV